MTDVTIETGRQEKTMTQAIIVDKEEKHDNTSEIEHIQRKEPPQTEHFK